MAYSKQNFQDGQILNAANLEAMENGIIAGQGAGAHNLLDNSDFRNYINQRGEISTADVWNYCIDRWRAIGTVGQLVWHNSDHVALGALRGISQAIENKSRFVGKTYTIAAKDIDGVLYITSGTYGGDNSHIWKETNGMELRLYSVSDDNNIYYSLKNLSSDTSKFIYLKWAALYEGSYDASTLPTYQPKGYAAELAECMRYYQIIPEQTSCAFSTSAQSNKYFASSINFPQMRIAPTVTLKTDSNGNIGVVQGVAFVSASEFDFAYKLNGTLLPATTNANYAGKVMSLYGIELNADL